MNRKELSHHAQRFATSPFWVLVSKEIRDHVKSVRFNILMAIIVLACIGSLYTALTSVRDVAGNLDPNQELYLYLKIFTITGENGALPPFVMFISLLGPLLGIAMGFDAINSEKNNRTLLRIMSQPLPRDYIILAKFIGSLFVIAFMVFVLGFLIFGIGILMMGIPPTFSEFIRVFVYLLMIVVYIGFYLALAILFSILFKQAATSALSGIAIWLFFGIFYSMLVQLMVNSTMPENIFQPSQVQASQEQIAMLMRLSPNYLFSEITTVLLNPGFRTLGPITIEQAAGAIKSPLDIGQSLTIIWPQFIGILALTMVCFLISYAIFMRQEIRS